MVKLFTHGYAFVELNCRSNQFRKWCWIYLEYMAIASHVLHNISMDENDSKVLLLLSVGFYFDHKRYFSLSNHRIPALQRKNFNFWANYCVRWCDLANFRIYQTQSKQVSHVLIRLLAHSSVHNKFYIQLKYKKCTNKNSTKGQMETKLRAKRERFISFNARCQ